MIVLPVSFTDRASRDFSKLFDYVLDISKSDTVAENYILRLRKFCRNIGNVPGGGVRIGSSRIVVRRRVFESKVVVVYRIRAEQVEILRVVSARRNLKKYRR